MKAPTVKEAMDALKKAFRIGGGHPDAVIVEANFFRDVVLVGMRGKTKKEAQKIVDRMLEEQEKNG